MIIRPQSYQPAPLTSWGGFSGQRRLSDSPFIESVWEGVASRSGMHATAADGTIDLTFQKRQGVTRLLLSAPSSRAYATPFEAGDEVLTARLRTGVHLTYLNGAGFTDTDMALPSAGGKRVWLHTHSFALPHFDTVEVFAEHLFKARLLSRDIVVEQAMSGKLPRTDIRTVQRHFRTTTGLTMSHVRQIRRAEKARSLLASSSSLTTIAYEAGYSNPGHMTSAFKYFFGHTPSTLRTLMGR